MKRLLLIGIVLVLAAGAGVVVWSHGLLTRAMDLPEDGLVVQVPRGASLSRVLETQLLYSGAMDITTTEVVRIYARLDPEAGRIQAGEFLIPPGSTPLDLLRVLSQGQPVQYSFTIVEGLTFRQMLAALHQHEAIQVELADASDAEILAAVGAEEAHPEGLFLPDTYHFPRGETDTAFLRRAYGAMRRLLEEEWPARDHEIELTTPYEALIMASIVEKETGVPEERPTIAGVFERRLERRMRLETDPTVIYGLGDAFDGDLRRRDLDSDTPYNTYTRHGLPPTPIALPGPAAIRAVLHPEDGEALFFVAMGDGRHYFSATYDEHLEAVRRYQLRR